jgi:hypothetical protein
VSHVFLSYARRDQVFVDRLIGELERAGLDVWIDREDIPGGAAWEATITSAVRASTALVVVLSPAAVESEYVPKELSLADKFDRPIIPVLLAPWDDAAGSERAGRLDFQLAGLQYVDFARQPFEAGLADLLRALRGDASSAPRPAPAAPPARRSARTLAAAAGGLIAVGLAVLLATHGRDVGHGIDGTWQADVTYSWGTHATERFDFAVDGETVNGTASFLGAPRGILDGRLKDGWLTFRTRIEGGPNSPGFWNAYRGRRDGDVIRLLLRDDRGSPPLVLTAERAR